MTQKSITIKASLDARQAAYFVQTAGKFESEIQVSVDEKRINAKSWRQYWHNFFIQSSNHYIQKNLSENQRQG